MHDAGSMPHPVVFIKISPGATLDQVIAAAQLGETPEGFAALTQVATFYGGPGGIDPGQTVMSALSLSPGSYALGDPQHLGDGVVAQFAVTAPPSDVAPPLADVNVTQREFAFDAPDIKLERR